MIMVLVIPAFGRLGLENCDLSTPPPLSCLLSFMNLGKDLVIYLSWATYHFKPAWDT